LEQEQLVRELNKILMFEHGHLGIYAAQAKRVKDNRLGDNMIDAYLMYLWLKDRLETGGTLEPKEII